MLATGKEETFNRILGLVTKYKDDKAKVDAFISKDNEVRRLFKAKGVKLSDLVRSVIK
jgi:hypothetical protein